MFDNYVNGIPLVTPYNLHIFLRNNAHNALVGSPCI